MKIRPSKDQAIRAAINLTPQFAEHLREFEKSKGLSFFKKEVAIAQNHYGQYVLVYDDEQKIARAFLYAALGEDGVKKLNTDFEKMSPQEQQKWIESISDDHEIVRAFSSTKFLETPEDIQAAKNLIANLPEEKRKLAEKEAAFFWIFLFSTFFNTLSLMVHGSKLTTLVPLAIAGDDQAFLKAIQIDRMLLLHYPYFRDRKFRAQDEGDTDFLAKIHYRESNTLFRSKIRYPALYMLFGILDAYTWLDELKHREILDICEEAGLDRFQNGIEDENSITKRLSDYRAWQKSEALSMHSN